MDPEEGSEEGVEEAGGNGGAGVEMEDDEDEEEIEEGDSGNSQTYISGLDGELGNNTSSSSIEPAIKEQSSRLY